MTRLRPRPEALVVVGLLLVALAVGVGTTWVDDGDGTCGALYRPNLSRHGCSRKLLPVAVSSALLVGGAVLVWDAARRPSRRPSRGAAAGAAITVLAVCALFVARSAADRRSGTDRGPVAPPRPAPTLLRP